MASFSGHAGRRAQPRRTAHRSGARPRLRGLLLYGLAAGAGWLTTAPHAAGPLAPHADAAATDQKRTASPAAIAMAVVAQIAPAPRRLAGGVERLLGARPPPAPARRAETRSVRGRRGVQIQLSDQWPFESDAPAAPGEGRAADAERQR